MAPQLGITGEFVARLRAAPRMPDEVLHAAKRMLLNVVGTTVGAIGAGRVENLISFGELCGGAAVVNLPGDGRRLDRPHAALVIGSAAHAEDFDDTHLLSIVHPAATAFGATYAAADDDTSGMAFLQAVAASCEMQIRLALCLEPPVREHHPASFTGLFGTLGAALACSMLAGLDVRQINDSITLALASSIGSRQSLGSFAKPLHTGKAAWSGLTAAGIAARGVDPTRAEDPIEGERGVLQAHFDGRVSFSPLLDRLGDHWEIVDVAFKPYPCGVLLHPLIDAALAVRGRVSMPQIRRILVACNAAVAQDTSITDPKDSLQAKFSASHAVAVALVDGVLGLRQYELHRVRDPEVGALRQRIFFEIDTDVAKDAAILRIECADGSVVVEEVLHARGSRARPMSDDELIEKTEQLFADRLPGRARPVWEAILALENGSLAGLREVLAP